MDFDKIKSYGEMEHLRNRLIKTPCVCCVFVTPSGKGLKALVLHDNTDPAMHEDLYEQLLQKFNVASKDKSCKDLARRNYLSYDPNIWTNPNPVPYHYVPSTKTTIQVQQVMQTQPKNHYAKAGEIIGQEHNKHDELGMEKEQSRILAGRTQGLQYIQVGLLVL